MYAIPLTEYKTFIPAMHQVSAVFMVNLTFIYDTSLT